MNQQQKKQETCPGSSHPSGLEESELAYVSVDFWSKYDNGVTQIIVDEKEKFSRLLSFQQGWKACRDFYKIQS